MKYKDLMCEAFEDFSRLYKYPPIIPIGSIDIQTGIDFQESIVERYAKRKNISKAHLESMKRDFQYCDKKEDEK